MCPYKFMCNIITQAPTLTLPHNVAAPLSWTPYLKLPSLMTYGPPGYIQSCAQHNIPPDWLTLIL